MIVVGLSGKMGAGKDTAADYLVAKHGFQKLAFAGDLKLMLAQLDPIIDDQGTRLSHVTREFSKGQYAEMEAHLKRHFPEYRRLLQVLGTECIRNRDSGFWADRVVDTLRTMPDNSKVVITDCRFRNEAEAVMYSGHWRGEVWDIYRPSLPTGPASAHSSEQGLADGEYVARIANGGSLADLYAALDRELGSAGFA